MELSPSVLCVIYVFEYSKLIVIIILYPASEVFEVGNVLNGCVVDGECGSKDGWSL